MNQSGSADFITSCALGCSAISSYICQISIQHRNAEQTKTPLFYFHKVTEVLGSLSPIFFSNAAVHSNKSLHR